MHISPLIILSISKGEKREGRVRKRRKDTKGAKKKEGHEKEANGKDIKEGEIFPQTSVIHQMLL